MANLMEWFDLLWVPVAVLVCKGSEKIKSAFFVLTCVLMLRLQVSLMERIGFNKGFLQWIDMSLLHRGMIVYGVAIVVFLALVAWSKGSNTYVFIAAGITVFIAAFIVSTVVMVI
ncbi:MAG: hypothetical protein AAF988_03915 [Pseudomonadota bacterium]